MPDEPTIGSGMNVRLACFTMSFFDALLAIGTDREYAIELVADVTWRVYRTWSVLASALTHLTPGKRTALAFAVKRPGKAGGAVSLTFPFNAPGYVIETVPVEAGTAFNVLRCPVAEYFRKQGAADLCSSSWCNLDYPLAELTDEKLVRTSTLVTGGHHCDFRLSPRLIERT
ncbi:MAG: L-2-amino-thiazoline-4-carboxylic acid hydrolase [Sphingomonas sp.]